MSGQEIFPLWGKSGRRPGRGLRGSTPAAARVGPLLREGDGLLLDFGGRASLQRLDGRWGDRVRYVARDAKDRLGLSAVLVRPDGVVAWASDAAPDPEAVAEAAARWFSPRAPCR